MASTTAKRRNPIYEGFRDELQGDIAALEKAARPIAGLLSFSIRKKTLRSVSCFA
jgi:hypothetical protein